MRVNKLKSRIDRQGNIAFKAGLTTKMAKEMLGADVVQISAGLKKQGIDCDFKGNNVIAWCSEKTVQIFRELNNRFGLKLDLPEGIFVDDFEKFDIDEKTASGICNMFPTEDHMPGRTVFFNSFDTLIGRTPQNQRWEMDWKNINDIADSAYLTKHSATDHFLGIFLHEFAHNAHEGVMLKKVGGRKLIGGKKGGEKLLKLIEMAQSEQLAQEIRDKYADRISQICRYALKNPLEAVACDVSRVVANVLDTKTLMPTRNPFLGTPYQRPSFWQKRKMTDTPEKDRSLDEILRNFWNGRFE